MEDSKAGGKNAYDNAVNIERNIDEKEIAPGINSKKSNKTHNIKKQALGPNTKRQG